MNQRSRLRSYPRESKRDPCQRNDWAAVAAIYQEGIATKNATFETEVPEYVVWDANHREDCRLVKRYPVLMEGRDLELFVYLKE